LAVSLLGPTLSGDKYQLMIRLSNIFLGAVKALFVSAFQKRF
jgi:hypothetical protein